MSGPATGRPARILLVCVGTDHHRFARLAGWTTGFAGRHPGWHVVVQHGSTPAPGGVEAHAFLDRGLLLDLMASADAVVTHGGPATITEARRAGHLPVVVPRDPARGEHVDDHQVRFARHLAGSGVVRLVPDVEDLDDAVLACARTAAQRLAVAAAPVVPEGVARFGRVVEQVVERAARRRPAP